MTETALLTMLKNRLLTITGLFSTGDVTINDWGVLDGSNSKAPFAIIQGSDDWSVTGIVEEESTSTWNIAFWLFEKFIDWDTSRDALITDRGTIISSLLAVDGYADADAKLAWGLREIQGGPIMAWKDAYVQNVDEALPVYIAQKIILTVEEIN